MANISFGHCIMIASLIRRFLVSSNFLSDNVNATLSTLFAPPANAESIHLAVSLICELSICMELVAVNPVITFRPCE